MKGNLQLNLRIEIISQSNLSTEANNRRIAVYTKHLKSMSSLGIVPTSRNGVLKIWVDAEKLNSLKSFNTSIKLVSQVSLLISQKNKIHLNSLLLVKQTF